MQPIYIKKRNALKRENWKIFTIPNILTFFRIGVLPFLLLAFFLPTPVGDCIALTIFILASLTDYIDGYIARRFQQTSKFGAFLDPIADKLLISVVLLMLAGTGRIQSYALIPASIILCREIVISGLREFLSAIEQELPVAKLAKYKTALQMMALTALLLNGVIHISGISWIGSCALWSACFLTLITGINYVRASMQFVKSRQAANVVQRPNPSTKCSGHL